MRFASIFRAPRRARLAPRSESRDAAHWSTSVRAVGPLCPRGPRSGAGYSVPIHPHLFDPIRPTRGHNSISPLSGLYALPLLCVMAPVSVASATHEWFRAFAGRSVSTCRPLGPREIPRRLTPSFFTDDAGLRPKRRVSALPISHTPILMGGFISGLTYGSLSLQPVDLLAPLVGADQASTQPTGTCTSGLSTVWSPAPPPDITTETTGQFSLAGLPARTPTSIAATASSNPACRFPALGFPVCFLSRVMWLIRAERLATVIAIHDPVIIKQSESVVDPSRTPPLPAESFAPSRT